MTYIVLHDQLTRVVFVIEVKPIGPFIAAIMVSDDKDIIQITGFNREPVTAFLTISFGEVVDVARVEVDDPVDVVVCAPVYIREYAGVSFFGSLIVVRRIADPLRLRRWRFGRLGSARLDWRVCFHGLRLCRSCLSWYGRFLRGRRLFGRFLPQSFGSIHPDKHSLVPLIVKIQMIPSFVYPSEVVIAFAVVNRKPSIIALIDIVIVVLFRGFSDVNHKAVLALPGNRADTRFGNRDGACDFTLRPTELGKVALYRCVNADVNGFTAFGVTDFDEISVFVIGREGIVIALAVNGKASILAIFDKALIMFLAGINSSGMKDIGGLNDDFAILDRRGGKAVAKGTVRPSQSFAAAATNKGKYQCQSKEQRCYPFRFHKISPFTFQISEFRRGRRFILWLSEWYHFVCTYEMSVGPPTRKIFSGYPETCWRPPTRYPSVYNSPCP